MDIKDLKVFHTIAKEESIAKASRILYMTPQGISKIVKNLEAEMGCRLFTRNKSGMQLTESGRRFLEYAITGSTRICRQSVCLLKMKEMLRFPSENLMRSYIM